jgi:hypothetical protein
MLHYFVKFNYKISYALYDIVHIPILEFHPVILNVLYFLTKILNEKWYRFCIL